MRQLRIAICVLGLSATLVPSASASHPTQMCLDIDPDQASPMSNDDIIDSIWAYPGATDADHPPQYEGCVTERTGPDQDWTGTQIDFEITGVADPDGSDTPTTPDLTCTVGEGGGGCAVHPPSSGGGEQTIRAWIDLDSDDATVEADTTEGWDEDSDPGSFGEPDLTDVALWTWTHGDPPPCDSGNCPVDSRVTVSYRDGVFGGSVHSDYPQCERDRVVKLWKERPGSDRLKDKDRTNADGDWRIRGFRSARGRHYVTVSQQYAGMQSSGLPTRLDCLADRSRVIRV